MCVNRHALRAQINFAALLMVEKIKFCFESIQILNHHMASHAHFKLLILRMEHRNVFLSLLFAAQSLSVVRL